MLGGFINTPPQNDALHVRDRINSHLAGNDDNEIRLFEKVFVNRGGDTIKGDTNLGAGSAETATTEMQISSLTDTWLLLYNRETNGEHNRQLYLLKSRGMAHSNQVREFLMSAGGISLREVYVGPDGVLTGSARLAQEAKDRADRLLRTQEVERRTREIVRRRREIAAQIETLQAQLASEEGEMELLNLEGSAREDQRAADRIALAQSRASRRAASSSSKLMTSGK